MRPLKSSLPPEYIFRYANQHFCMKSKEYNKWNDGTNGGMPATRIYRACMTSPLDWLLMCAVAAVKSDYWRKDPGDWFACGIGGKFDDQVVNASIQWQNLENTGDLRLNEMELQQVDLVYQDLCVFCAHMAEAEQGEPLPQPPPPPKPVPPAPVPTPVEPAKPEPKPEEPKPPAAPGSWKKTSAMLAGVLGAAIIAAKIFAPGWVVLALEAIRQLLAALGG